MKLNEQSSLTNDRLSDTCRVCWEKKKERKNEKEREGYVSVLFNDDEPVLSVCAWPHSPSPQIEPVI